MIAPAIAAAREKKILAFGPYASDGFFGTEAYRHFDGVLAMYHDQGLTPFKTLTPDGVNFTANLRAVRTSPDHGTAFDIAGQDKANPIATILSAAMMFRYSFHLAEEADTVEAAVGRAPAWAAWSANPLQRAEREKSHRDMSVKDLPQTEKEE